MMAETLALIPVDRKERRGAAGCTEYILSENIDAILSATEAIFLPDCAIDAADITADTLTTLMTDAVDSDRVQICHSVAWRWRHETPVSFTILLWDYPRFPAIDTAEEVCLLTFEHGKAIFPISCDGVEETDETKTLILDDAYLLRPPFMEHVLVEYDPVKAVRLMLRRLNQADKSYTRPPRKRLSKDQYQNLVNCLRTEIYTHPAIHAGIPDVVERCWGLPRARGYFTQSLVSTSQMAEALFGRQKPWRKKLKPILLHQRDTILRALENPAVEMIERRGVDWLLGEMKALRIPGVKAWLRRTRYLDTKKAAE